MSWSFNLVSQNSKALQEEVAKQEHCPPNLREYLSKTIEEMMVHGLEDKMAFRVDSTGHHDGKYGSYGNFKVEKVGVVE